MCITNAGLEALTTGDELREVQAVGKKPRVKLRRTFNQSDFQGGYVKYWRVISPPTHSNINSDLSLAGLIEWGIIADPRSKETI